MGCAACTQVSGNQKDNIKTNFDFLQIAKNKIMFIKKALSKQEEKKFLYDYFSEQQLNRMLHLMSLQEELRPQNILLPQAGENFYLTQTRRTLWKLYSLDLLVYEYAKNPVIHQFTEDFQNIKISDKIQQRFYEISLDINRTFPLIKNLDKNHLTLVLKNLTLYFQGVGYTQGMNFIVGFLLLCGFEPKQAYWMFINLSFNQNFLFIRNFSEGFGNPMFIIKIFEQFMDRNQKLKQLRERLEEMGLNGFIYSFSWFLCYFIYSLDPKCCVLVWDFLLTYNPHQYQNNKNPQPLNETKKAITQKSQYQMEEQKKQQNYPQYFANILSHRGTITSLIQLACEVMDFLENHVYECQSPEQIMKLFRNQSLMEKITPQITIGMIQTVKNKNSQLFGSSQENNWKSFVQKMKKQDKQLYQIYAHQSAHKNFIEQCIGFKRKYDQSIKPTKLKVESKDKN